MERISFEVNEAQRVSALLEVPASARAAFVLAHGAGAGMNHPFMDAMALGLFERGLAVLRYQFPFMENGSKRPDLPALAQATVRAAVHETSRQLPGVPLFAGGKSFGGRMTSQAQAAQPMPDVRAIVFLGFPLHAADKPSLVRSEHLARVLCPMLFLQGTRDKLADFTLIESMVQSLGARATLESITGADHGFHVLVRSGRTDAQVLVQLLDALVRWIDRALQS